MVMPSVASRLFDGAPGARASNIRWGASHAAKKWPLVTQTGGSPASGAPSGKLLTADLRSADLAPVPTWVCCCLGDGNLRGHGFRSALLEAVEPGERQLDATPRHCGQPGASEDPRERCQEIRFALV